MTAPTPIDGRERIEALDVTRGVAVLGILLLNIWSFAGPREFFAYPTAIADMPGAPMATWAVVQTLFEGSQRGLLSLLFGAGALMLLDRLGTHDRAAESIKAVYYRRTILLILFGLFNAYVLMWPADILFAYGLCGLLLYPLRHFSARWLLLILLATLMVPTVLRVVDIAHKTELAAVSEAAAAAKLQGRTIDAAQKVAIADWAAEMEEARPSLRDAKLQDEIRVMQKGGLVEIATRQAKASLILQTIVLVRYWFIDALAGMLLGMALYRAGVLAHQAPPRVHVTLLVTGFAIGIPLSVWTTQTLLAADFHPLAAATTDLAYDLRRLAMSVGYLAAVFWFCRLAAGLWLKRALAAAGRMALTNYLAQSVLCGLLFYGFGLGLYGRVFGYQLYLVVAAVWILELYWSLAWLRRFRFGPLEWLWRSLAYRRAQPL